MRATAQNIWEAFNQLPESEKHELAVEITLWLARQDFPPLTDEELVRVADDLFVELDQPVQLT